MVQLKCMDDLIIDAETEYLLAQYFEMLAYDWTALQEALSQWFTKANSQ